ncbi:hypothetical protein HOG48_00460 [Candidatus Peregrinibacteria bacterium]|jgi:hypothetical protein|nr:hypothetical protein [Candidatus Peregrinibacteria bacterium]
MGRSTNCVYRTFLILTLILLLPLQVLAVRDLTFEERNTDIPVTIDGHLLQSPWGYGQPSANYPTLIDIDNDEDLDLFMGSGDGTLLFYRNQGGQRIADFVLEDREYLGIKRSQYILFPTFADIDNDSDFDLYFGEWGERVNFYKNRGNMNVPDLVFANGSEAVVDVKNFAAPEFVDIDDDEDLDLFVGNFEGRVFYYENVGNPNTAQFILTDSQYLDIELNKTAVPKFTDIDDDGDLDLFVGSDNGRLAFYRNQGSPRIPEFELINDTFIEIEESYVYPTFGDLDNDGDTDLFIGNNLGNMYYFQNNGSNTSPSFTKVTDEYFHLDIGENGNIDFADFDDDGDEDLFMLDGVSKFHYFQNIGSASAPSYNLEETSFIETDENASAFSIGDLDHDNDLDIVMGYFDRENEEEGGHLNYYKNIGSVRTPKFLLQEGVFTGIDVGEASTPELHDYDNDGDLDLFVGGSSGKIHFYRNTGSLSEPIFTLETDSFEDIDVDAYSQIRFEDIDSDEDYDALLGNKHGRVIYYENVKENIGKNFLEAGELTEDLGFNTGVALLDIDYDNKMDFFVTTSNGNIHHFRQTSKNLFPPENPTNLKVEIPYENIMKISWNKSLNSENDLAEYRLYEKINNEIFTGSTSIGKDTSVNIIDFNRFLKYGFKVTAKDVSGLESDGIEVQAYFRDNDLIVQTINEPSITINPETISSFCASFPDVKKDVFSVSQCSAITFVKDEGIFSGNDDGTLAPERPINRAEVTKVLIEAFGLDIKNADGSEFSDISKHDWFANYIKTALDAEIVQGYSDGTFKPSQTINKVELLKVVLEMAEIDFSSIDIGTSLYADIEATPNTEWFLQYTNFAQINGLLDVVGEVLNPNQPMTRMDVIELLYRMKQKGLAF